MNLPAAVTLVLARPTDAQVMADMSRDLIEAGLVWRYTPARMAALIDDAETSALLARDVTGILGFAIMHFGDEQAHLSLLCVRPEQRRRGIARSLNQWLVESARVAGSASIQLELRADNSDALMFYQRLGFRQTQTVPRYYGAHLAALRMVLPLRPEAAKS